ncbi:uncharacterized protein [Ranitomeya imitator]|uniref:uncharacterized protein isoform X2 n=1 Tax=Ranitomeya imitator TaxID=111125 RepID=UPI0037E8996F
MFSQEAEAAEGLSEEDERGGEIQGAGAQSVSQCAPNSDDEQEQGFDVDLLIEEVREREPLWNMTDRWHSDKFIKRRLWLEVCHNVISN